VTLLLDIRIAFCLTLIISANGLCAQSLFAPAIAYNYDIIAERNHNPSLFTQGLVLDNDEFYESSGLYEKSFLARYPVAEPATKDAQPSTKFTRKALLPARYFAEGLTLFENKLYLLTWQEQTLLIYNRDTFALEKKLPYNGQGWGLTHDQKHLIRSDGSHRLYFHRADDFSVARTIEVYRDMNTVERLNELEYVNGKIWANIWYDNKLVQIDPQSGRVVGYVDLSRLIVSLQLTNDEQVLNGIAYDPARDAFWITGKMWPKMFLIKINTN
jgi:glutamine cyclotransferase